MIPSRGVQWSSRTIGIGRRRLEGISTRSFSSFTPRNARLSAAPFAREALLSKATTRPQFAQLSAVLKQPPSKRFKSTAAAATTTTTAAAPASPTTDALAEAASTSATSPSSLDAAIDLITNAKDAPEHIGYLKSLGLDYGYGPTAIVEWCLEHTHVYLGTPWWASIAITAVLFRLAFVKLYMGAADNAARNAAVAPQTKPLTEKMMEYARSNDQTNVMAVRREIQVINRRAGIKMWKSFVPMVQVFTGYGTFVLLRAMAKLPVPGLETGGILWFQDLTVPDPYLLLPAAAAGVLHLVLKNGGETGSTQMSENTMKLMSYGLPAVSILATFWLPAGVQVSFLVTGLWSAFQVTIFRNAAFRSFCNIAPLPSPPQAAASKDKSPYRADILTAQQLRERSEAPAKKGVRAVVVEKVEEVKDSARQGLKTAKEYAGQERKAGKRTKAEIAKAEAYEKKRQAEEKKKEVERREWRRLQKEAAVKDEI